MIEWIKDFGPVITIVVVVWQFHNRVSDKIEKRFEHVSQRFDRVEQRADRIEERMSMIEQNLAEVKGMVRAFINGKD